MSQELKAQAEQRGDVKPTMFLTPDDVKDSLRKAYWLGQRYWQQADSVQSSEHRKAEDTEDQFKVLMVDVCNRLSATPAPVAPTRTTKDWCTTMAQLEAGHSVTAGCYAKPLADACRIPPDGWLCTREPGHDGPCAAVFHAPPAPAVPDDVALRERLTAISDAIADGDDRAAQAIIAAMIAAAPEVKPC